MRSMNRSWIAVSLPGLARWHSVFLTACFCFVRSPPLLDVSDSAYGHAYRYPSMCGARSRGFTPPHSFAPGDSLPAFHPRSGAMGVWISFIFGGEWRKCRRRPRMTITSRARNAPCVFRAPSPSPRRPHSCTYPNYPTHPTFRIFTARGSRASPALCVPVRVHCTSYPGPAAYPFPVCVIFISSPSASREFQGRLRAVLLPPTRLTP
ncbi:hypothetical protein B0H19DRAFT_1382827 [Mycena capillaripes]|nr:hypothetical protein B0H19DRAFT_1382827 [Mycena capillaripes]